jgi:hypothetical protein
MRKLRLFGRPPVLEGTIWCAFLATLLAHRRFLSGSVDTSFHLQVADAMRGVLVLPASAEAWMPAMYPYPKLSHRLAGMAMDGGQGPLSALMFVAVMSAAIAWLALLDQARRASLFVLAAGVALTLVNVFATRAVLGAEGVHNFFYPQMVGEAFCMLALVVGASAIDRAPRRFVIWAAATVLLAQGFHLVPTIKLAGAFMALMGVELLRRMIAERKADWAAIVGIVATAAAVVGNPFFWTMRRIAENNGSVNFGAALPLPQLTAAAVLLAVFSAWLLIAEALRRTPIDGPRRAVSVLAALGAAAAAGLLAQLALFSLAGEGSEYAVRKHGFGVFTLLAFVLPAWIAEAPKLGALKRIRGPAWVGLALLLAGHAAILSAVFVRPSVFDVRAADQMLKDARKTRLARGIEGEKAMFVTGAYPPVLSFIASTAMLRTPISSDAIAMLTHGRPERPGDLDWIVTTVGDEYDKPECREGHPIGDVVAVHAPCLAPPSLLFKAGGSGAAYLGEGWSAPEAGGTWSTADQAVVRVPLTAQQAAWPAAKVRIATFGFLPPEDPKRSVTVRIAGAQPQTYAYDRSKALSHGFELTVPGQALRSGRLEVVFEIREPAKAEGAEHRRLGVGIEAMQILPAQP